MGHDGSAFPTGSDGPAQRADPDRQAPVLQSPPEPVRPQESEPQEQNADLGRTAAAGALWMTAQKWLVRLSGLATIAILTRLISPSDFGTVAAAATVTPFVLLLSELGLSTYIVQATDPSQRTLSTGFWFSAAASAGLSLALVGLAPLIAAAFGLTDATEVLRALSVSVVLSVMASVPSALLRRALRFKTLAVQSGVAALVAQIVAVAVALRGGGAWALVAQIIVWQTITCVMAWRAARWTPGLAFSPGEFVVMARFGVKVVLVEIVATGRAMAEAAIISNALGAAALGYLSVAQKLIQVSADLGATALIPISTVVFAKVRDSGQRLRSAYLKALRVAYAAVSPVMTFVAVAGPMLIHILYGPGWEPSAPVAQALAISAILILGAGIDHGLHYGLGRPGRWLGYATVTDLTTVAVTASLAAHGLVAVAVGFVGVALTATLARWGMVARLLKMPWTHIAGVFGKAAIAVVASASAGLVARSLTDQMAPLASAAITGLAIAATHVLALRLISPDVLDDVLDVLPGAQRIVQRLPWARASRP